MLTVFNTPDQVANAAADKFVLAASQAIQQHGRFSVALSGGSTPKKVYEQLASPTYSENVDWRSTHIFFGDERCVPFDDPDSNYRMAHEALLAKVPIPHEKIHPIKGDGDPAEHAQAYERTMRGFFSNLEWPLLDLTFLGLGEDGHTASLFPDTLALREERAWVVANWVEKLKSFRITLTAPAINSSRDIVFLVTGEKKAAALAQVINGPRDPQRLPAQLIQPVDGSLEWLVDRAAASQLESLRR